MNSEVTRPRARRKSKSPGSGSGRTWQAAGSREALRRPSRFKKKKPSRFHPSRCSLMGVGGVSELGRSANQSPQRSNHAIIRVIKNLLHGNARTSCLPNSSVTGDCWLFWERTGGQGRPGLPRCVSPRPWKSRPSYACVPPGDPVFPGPAPFVTAKGGFLLRPQPVLPSGSGLCHWNFRGSHWGQE